jgi:DNA-binding transcriptional ArsR family regulator
MAEPAIPRFRFAHLLNSNNEFIDRSLDTRSIVGILKNMLNHRPTLDLMFQALADPTRRVIVERLSLGPASVSELAKPLSMSLPAVVQHLHVLEASGLVRSEKVGRVRTCRIEPAALQSVERWIADRRKTWERRLDRLGEHLDPRGDQ